MLSLSAISIIFSIFFLFLTYCLSRRLYHFYLVSDKDQPKTNDRKAPIYRPEKDAHTLQYFLLFPLMSPACAKPLPPNNLLLELWNHAQWKGNHGIFIPFLQYRPSEAFFEYTIFVFITSTFCMVFYLLLSSKSGGDRLRPTRRYRVQHLLFTKDYLKHRCLRFCPVVQTQRLPSFQ